MPKASIDFAEWRPDLALVDASFASTAHNVFAGANSYLPFPGLAQLTSTPLPGKACGLSFARTNVGVFRIYAGNQTDLFRWSGTGWTNLTRTSGGGYHVADGDLWRFRQNGTHLLATNINDVVQDCDIEAGTNFVNLAGSPPQATNIAQIGPFVVLGGELANRRKIQWSAIENRNGWTIGLNLSDEQEMPDGGQVQGVDGGEIGYIVQDQAIRTLQWLPGDTQTIFSISRVVHDRGCVSKYGFTCVGDVLYWAAWDGFYAVSGAQLFAIGDNKVNDWFVRNSDPARRNLVLAFNFNDAHRVGWAFHGSATSEVYDKLLIYDWVLQRWTLATISAQIWAAAASQDLDLDTTGTEPGDALLDSTALSLDSFAYMGGQPMIGAIDPNGFLCALNGNNLLATIETGEMHFSPGQRTYISDAYPLVDAGPADIMVSVGTRERLQDTVQWGVPVPLEITGSASLLSSSRLHKFRVSVAANAIWNHAQKVQTEIQPDGEA